MDKEVVDKEVVDQEVEEVVDYGGKRCLYSFSP